MANRKRTIRHEFHVTEQEQALIEQRMAELGTINLSAYLRKMALNGYIVRVDLSDVRELVRLLRNATNNINQIAHHANEANIVYRSDIRDIQRQSDRLWKVASCILEKLAAL